MLNKKLLLIMGCAGLASCTKAEAAAPSQENAPIPFVHVDGKRQAVCYIVAWRTGYGPGYAISCVPLDATNSHAIGR